MSRFEVVSSSSSEVIASVVMLPSEFERWFAGCARTWSDEDVIFCNGERWTTVGFCRGPFGVVEALVELPPRAYDEWQRERVVTRAKRGVGVSVGEALWVRDAKLRRRVKKRLLH